MNLKAVMINNFIIHKNIVLKIFHSEGKLIKKKKKQY